MSRRRPHNYLRTHRKQWGLSQEELGELLDLCKDAISKYELGRRPMTARLLVACEIIFGVRIADLFPSFVDSVEEDLAIRANALLERIGEKGDAKSEKKLKLLEGIPARMSGNGNI